MNLYLRLLPASVLIKGFVHGENADYETCLREFVNASAFFLEKSRGQPYAAPPSEHDHQPDCISDAYAIDFKLIASSSALEARSLFSSRDRTDQNGVTVSGIKAKNKKSINAVRIHSALRKRTLTDLYEIRNRRWDDDPVRRDIKELLTTLETDKNLLLFYPYEFSPIPDGLPQIQASLSADFGPAMEYRKLSVPKKETFFSFIYSDHLIILEDFRLMDKIPISASPAFCRLRNHKSPGIL